jgi:hypothetical protein
MGMVAWADAPSIWEKFGDVISASSDYTGVTSELAEVMGMSYAKG